MNHIWPEPIQAHLRVGYPIARFIGHKDSLANAHCKTLQYPYMGHGMP